MSMITLPIDPNSVDRKASPGIRSKSMPGSDPPIHLSLQPLHQIDLTLRLELLNIPLYACFQVLFDKVEDSCFAQILDGTDHEEFALSSQGLVGHERCDGCSLGEWQGGVVSGIFSEDCGAGREETVVAGYNCSAGGGDNGAVAASDKVLHVTGLR